MLLGETVEMAHVLYSAFPNGNILQNILQYQSMAVRILTMMQTKHWSHSEFLFYLHLCVYMCVCVFILMQFGCMCSARHPPPQSRCAAVLQLKKKYRCTEVSLPQTYMFFGL